MFCTNLGMSTLSLFPIPLYDIVHKQNKFSSTTYSADIYIPEVLRSLENAFVLNNIIVDFK